MEQIVIRVSNKEKAKILFEMLRALDFIEVIETDEETETTDTADADFFALAGIWEGRDITIEDIRKKAWPRQAS